MALQVRISTLTHITQETSGIRVAFSLFLRPMCRTCLAHLIGTLLIPIETRFFAGVKLFFKGKPKIPVYNLNNKYIPEQATLLTIIYLTIFYNYLILISYILFFRYKLPMTVFKE
jgi:hypothetical protein